MIELDRLSPEDIEFNPKSNPRYKICGTPAPGVTSITSLAPKNSLITWAAKEAVRFVADNWKPETTYTEQYISMCLKGAETAHIQKRDAAATKGTSVHEWANVLAFTGKMLPPPDDEQSRNSAREFYRWHKDYKPLYRKGELIVASKKQHYAGTLDILAEINGQIFLIDLKTSSGIWPDHYYQTAAYLMAAHEMGYIDEKKTKRAILRLPKDGRHYEFKILDDDDYALDCATFKALHQMYIAEQYYKSKGEKK